MLVLIKIIRPISIINRNLLRTAAEKASSSTSPLSAASRKINQFSFVNKFNDKKFHLLRHQQQQQQLRNLSTSSTMPPVDSSASAVANLVEHLINENKVVIFSKTTCPWCIRIKAFFDDLNVKYETVETDKVDNGDAIRAYLTEKTKQTTVPNIFVNGRHIGGHDDTIKAHKQGQLNDLLAETTTTTNGNVNDEPTSAAANLRPLKGESIESFVNNLIKQNKILVFSKSTCPYCAKVKELFKSQNLEFVALELDKLDEGAAIRDYLFEKTGQKTVPNVYVSGNHLGGCDSTLNAHAEGRLAKLLTPAPKPVEENYDYDLVVIGGGSGGLACSKAAAELGAKVAVLDFVKPTPLGTTWGLGGTCVNVGCIPKKLMHQAALLGEGLVDSPNFGWKTPEKIEHSWDVMKDSIQNYIGSLNWNYRVQLRDKKVEYINAFGEFINPNRLLITQKNKKTREITAKNVVIAVGGRPKYPEDINGAMEHCITSDDLFSLGYNPGKTLCVGASYVSLECAGFLKGIGLDVTVMVRSILLRGFDQQMANKIGDFMEQHEIKFKRGCVPVEITKIKEGQPGELLVKYKNDKGEIEEEIYNTVMLAVGREACTKDLKLDKCGVKVNPKTLKIPTNFEQTNVDNIYAIGDVIEESSANGRVLELTPVAIKAGQLLARRLLGQSDVKMDYYAVPTTVFTPLEYGAIGFSEEEAIEKFGADNIEVYHGNYWPLEWTVAHRPHDVCYAKLICNKLDKERVIGFHVAGPNAGEITQGYAIAIKLRATKKDFDMTVGIHPTCSEIFTTLNVTKSSGGSVAGSGC